MQRRQFITLLGGAVAAPAISSSAIRAQDRMPRIGALFVFAEGDPEGRERVAAFQDGLKHLGWAPGSNVQIDYRWAQGSAERLRALAAELVALKPDVIVATGTTTTSVLKQETSAVPIVFVQVIDPVGAGYVASLARPGGNMTGFAQFEYGVAVKWPELLKQIAPSVNRVAVIHDSALPAAAGILREIEAGATASRLHVFGLSIKDAADVERAVDAFAREPNSGLIVLASPFTAAHRDLLIELAARHHLPCVYPYRYFATSGGLTSYGIDNHDLYRRAASYVDRILRGGKPGDLPVQQATKFELVINLKTAKALSLDIPMSLLARTDEVIE